MEVNMVGLVVECVKILIILCGCMNLKMKNKPVAATLVFVLAQLCLVVQGIQDREYYVSTFMCIAIVIGALAVQGKRKWLLSVVAMFGVSCIDTLFCTIAVKLCGIPEEQVYNEFSWKLGLNAISLFLLVVAALLLQKYYYGKKMRGSRMEIAVQQSSRLYLGLLAIGLLSVIWFITPLSHTGFQWTTITEKVVIVMVYIFIFIFLLVGILLIFYHRSSNHYQELAKLNQKLLESKERYYRMMLEKEEETRRFRHDMASHVTCVK